MTSGGIAIARVRQPKLGLSGSERTSEGTGGRPAASRNALVSPFNRSRCWTSEVARSRGFLSKTATMDKKLIFYRAIRKTRGLQVTFRAMRRRRRSRTPSFFGGKFKYSNE